METEFTHGPWQVVDDYADYHEYSPENPQIYIWDGDEQAYGPICDMGEMGDMNYAECLARAKLIATAPELYKALKGLMKRYKELVDSGDCGFWKAEDESEYQIAQAALNKAT